MIPAETGTLDEVVQEASPRAACLGWERSDLGRGVSLGCWPMRCEDWKRERHCMEEED